MKKLMIWLPLVVLATAVEAQPPDRVVLQVAAFDVPADINLPADFRSALAANLMDRLRESGKFAGVISASTPSPDTQHASVRLTGSVTEFKKGSQSKRYLLGPGFGKTILKAHIRFVDVDSGKLLLEGDVDGKAIIGLFGGDSKGATNGLAKEVAKRRL
jgi:hypothetical protein